MMRSLYSAISGLRNHQTRMDVVANNISNVNTVGFKASRVIFQDVYSQMTRSPSAATQDADENYINGGTNPSQIGLGMKLAAIDVMHGPAAISRTDNPLDMMIAGDGYFIIEKGDKNLYTRAGNFYVDNAGHLVTATGDYVLGVMSNITERYLDSNNNLIEASILKKTNQNGDAFNVTASGNPQFVIDPLQNNAITDAATGNAITDAAGNLLVFDDEGFICSLDTGVKTQLILNGKPIVFDNDGYLCSLENGKLTRFVDDNESPITINAAGELVDDQGNNITADPYGTGNQNLVFNNQGQLCATDGATPPVLTILNAPNIPIKFESVSNPVEEVRYQFNGDAVSIDKDGNLCIVKDNQMTYLLDSNNERLTLDNQGFLRTSNGGFLRSSASNPTPGLKIKFGQDGQLVTFDDTSSPPAIAPFSPTLSGEIQLGNQNPVTPQSVGKFPDPWDGQKYGFNDLERINTLKDYIDITVDEYGVIRGVKKDDPTLTKVVIAQLILANFDNPTGLEKKGGSYYAETINSGGPDYNKPGEVNAGELNVGGLEMSNVDLSGEFTDMIITQRGFQANSRVITVSDTMLEELINLKR